ncbi:TonB-dependent receptor [Sneathiella limimaris]|uniref:TonB-dependent receptor n=1 Tax=Sneathiella limimaris TaxID=1964213 RepID=UPI00146A594B|nr:TonB-dependent receptor [Sneathiella limimaris]
MIIAGSTVYLSNSAVASENQNDVQRYEIPSGSAQKNLNEIAAKTGISLLIEADISDIRNETLSGDYKPLDAMKALLSGSGFQLKQVGDRTYSVVKASQSQNLVTLEKMVVTAGRAKRSSRAVPASVVVINDEEILQHIQGGGDAASLISKFVPGMASSNQTISGASQNFRGRGVQVLVDGQSLNTPLRNVSRTFTLVDLNQVERVEVVPGARSDYGNGATGGTINFITKQATTEHQLTVRLGTSAFTANVSDSIAPEVSVTATGTEGMFDYAATITAEMTRDAFTGNGDLAPSDPLIGQGGLDNSRSLNLSAKGGINFSDTQRLQASINAIELNQEPEYYTDYTTDPVSVDQTSPYEGKSIRERSQYYSLDFTDSETPLGNLEAKFFYDNINKRFAYSPISSANPAVPAFPGTTTPDINGQSEIETRRYGARLTFDTKLSSLIEGMKVTWGGDASYDETEQKFQDGQDRIAPMSQTGLAGFGQISVPFSIFEFTGGIRYEYFDLEIDDFVRPSYVYQVAPSFFVQIPQAAVTGGSHTYSESVFNAGVVAHVSEPVDVFVNYSEGFSIPDVGSFTSRAGFGGIPTDFSLFSPKANVVKSLETGLRYNKFGVRGEASVYVTSSDYGTTFDLATNSLSQQKERIWGVELSGEFPVNEWLKVGGVASYIKGRYDTDADGELDADLPSNRIPSEISSSLYADMYFWDDLNVRATGNFSGGRSGRDATGNFDIDPSFTMDLSARYPLLDGELALGVTNLLDSDQENVTATAVREFPIIEYGRRITINYTKTF